jgi:hypothetical protein
VGSAIMVLTPSLALCMPAAVPPVPPPITSTCVRIIRCACANFVKPQRHKTDINKQYLNKYKLCNKKP